MGVIYKFAKKCENPQGRFWHTMNFFFCQAMVIYGMNCYRKVKKQNPDKHLMLMPANSAGDILVYSYFKKYMLQRLNKSEEETLLLCSEYNKRPSMACGIKNACFLPMPQIAAISMALNYYGTDRMELTDTHKWCIFDYGNIQNPDIVPVRPAFACNPEKTAETLNKIGCVPGKTIVLSPYEQTLTLHKLPKPVPEFWTELSQAFKERGFCVCTNCRGDEKEPAVKGTEAVFPAFGECEELVSVAGGAVIIRSGFADFTAMTRGAVVVLYPDKDFFGNFRIWLTEKYGNHYEFIYENDLGDAVYRKKVIDSIVEKISDEKTDRCI